MADETIEKLVYQLDAKIDKAIAGFEKVEKAIGNTEKKVSASSKMMEKGAALISAAWAAVSVAILAAAGYAAKFTAGASVSMEQYITKMTNLYGSVDVARGKLKWLYDFAKNTPFELPGLIEAAASLKAYGIDVESTIGTLGDAAAALPGKTINDSVQMLSDAQTGQFERLAEFGMKAVEITSKNFAQLGAAEADVGKTALTYVTKEGQNAIKVIDRNNRDQITSSIMDILSSLYGGGMAAQAQTAAGIWSNVKDTVFQAANSFMGLDKATMTFRDGSLFDRMKKGLQGVLDSLNNIDFEKAGKGVEKFLGWIDKIKVILEPEINILKSFKNSIFGIGKDLVEGFNLVKFGNNLSGIKLLIKDVYAAFLLMGKAVSWVWGVIDKYDIGKLLGASFRMTLEYISLLYEGVHNVIVWAISEVVKSYNSLVPLMKKVGMDVETIAMPTFAPLAASAKKASEEVKTSMDQTVQTQKDALDEMNQNSQQQEIIPGKRASYASILGVDTAAKMGLSGVYGSMGYPGQNASKLSSAIPAAGKLPSSESGQPATAQQQQTSKYAEIIKLLVNSTSLIIKTLKEEPRKVDADIKFDMNIKTEQDVKKLERTIKQATSDGVHGKLQVI